MPLTRLRSWEEMLGLGTSDFSLWMDGDGKIVNTPKNLWPNQALVEIGEDGVPVGHDLSIDIAQFIGHHYLLSKPDALNRLESLARQNSATIPLAETSFIHQGAWIPGQQPEATSRVVPPTPELETAPNGSQGFPGGTYLLAVGWSSVFGPAGVGAYVPVTLQPGQYPVVPRPDSIPAGAATFDIAMTRPGGSADSSTARYQRKIPVEQLTSETVNVRGGWRNRGKPPATNRSGVPSAKRPSERDTGTMPSDFSTLAGRWTPAIQYWLPSLPGTTSGGTARVNIVGQLGKAIVVKGDKFRVKVAGPDPNAPVARVSSSSEDAEASQASSQGEGQEGATPQDAQTILAGQGRAVDIEQTQTGGDHPDGWENKNEIRNPQRDIQGDWSDLPKWMQEMKPGNFGGGKDDGKKPADANGGTGGNGEPAEPEGHYEWQQSQYAAKTALYFRLPKMVKRNKERLAGLKCTYWWVHESETGVITWYRAYDSRRGPTSYFDDTDAFDGRIECPGLPGDDAATGTEIPAGGDAGAPVRAVKGRGPRVRLIAEEPPTEDTTIIEPPDATSGPELLPNGGIEVLGAGRYAAAVVGVLEGGGVTNRSRAARSAAGDPWIQINANQTVKVVPSTTVNMIRNAEGSVANGAGEIEDWTIVNAAVAQPGFVRADDGIWRIGTSAPITPPASNPPRFESRRIALTENMIFAVGFTYSVNRVVAGSVRVFIRQFDAAGTNIGNITVGELFSLGETSEAKFYRPEDRAADARSVQVVVELRARTETGASTNLDAQVRDLRFFPFNADIGKYEEGEAPGDPANFAPPADTPAPPGSFVAVGPPPSPPGGAADAVPPLRIADFEDGTTGPFTLLGSSPDKNIITTNQLFGTRSLRLADLNLNQSQNAFLEATVSEAIQGPIALRTVYRFDTRPLVDVIRFHYLTTPALNHVAYLIMETNGRLSLYVDPNNTPPQVIPLGVTVPPNGLLDVELAVVPKRAGLVTVSVGLQGARRQTIFQRNFDLENRTAHVVRPGVPSANAVNNRWNVVIDNAVVTRDGDVLDRERPLPPSGIAVPKEDRPVKGAGAGTPRRLDARGDLVNQLRVFLNPGEGVERMPLLDDPVNVRPGLRYCVAAFGRWNVLPLEGDSSADAFGEIEIWLESDDEELPRRRIAEVEHMTGTRGWHPTGKEDDYTTFVVPDAPPNSIGYTRAVPELRIHPGFYVIQEFLFAQESATFTAAQMDTFAARDAQRDYTRAATGSGEWIMPVVPPHVGNGTPGPEPGWWLSEVGIKSIEPEPNDAGLVVGGIETSFETSPEGVDWYDYEEPGSQAYRLIRFNLTLSSVGERGYEVPAGGVFARSWTPVATLTRQDGSPFAGGAYVGSGIWISSYPQMDPRRVGDRLAPVPLSEVVNRLANGFSVAVMSEDAIEEIEYLAMIGRLRLEVPGMGNTVPGTGLTVRCEGGIAFEAPDNLIAVREFQGFDRRLIHAVGSTEYAEVLQSGELQRPMGPAIRLRA